VWEIPAVNWAGIILQYSDDLIRIARVLMSLMGHQLSRLQ